MLAHYISFCLSETACKFQGVWSDYEAIRINEITDISFDESSSVDLELEGKKYQLACALERNDLYNQTWRSLCKLQAEDGFIKDKKARFNKLQKKIQKIREEEQIHLFGAILPDTDSSFDTPLKHPLVLLREAVEKYESDFIKRANKEEADAAKTDEERKIEEERKKVICKKMQELIEKQLQKYPAPCKKESEDSVLIEGKNIGIDLEEPLVLCCCKRYKHYFEKGASGRAILTCPKCNTEVVVDYKKKKSELLDVIKHSRYMHELNND